MADLSKLFTKFKPVTEWTQQNNLSGFVIMVLSSPNPSNQIHSLKKSIT